VGLAGNQNALNSLGVRIIPVEEFPLAAQIIIIIIITTTTTTTAIKLSHVGSSRYTSSVKTSKNKYA
jgi:hypothetical protein